MTSLLVFTRLRQAVSYSREQVVEMMEFLIEYGPPRLYWEPAEVFHKLSCVQLLLQLISIACDWRTYYGRYKPGYNPYLMPFPFLFFFDTLVVPLPLPVGK